MSRGRWTNQIHDGWIRNLLKNRPDLTKDQLERTRKLMNERVLDCLVHNYEDLMKSIALVKNIRQRLKKPPISANQYLSILFPSDSRWHSDSLTANQHFNTQETFGMEVFC
ncbi:MAG: hypothetical protein ACXU9U_02120 [Parachlamydiaceae bacterium]